MSASDSIGYFVELGEYNLIIARTTLGQRPRTVEAIQEVWLGDAAAADAALGEIRAGSTSAKAVALLRLKSRSTFLANADQAKSVTAPDAVENFLRAQLGAEQLPANWAWCGASTGLAPQAGSPWALDAAPAATTEEIINKLRGWSFELVRCQSAPLTLAGALASAAQNSCVLHLELSEFSTSLLSVTKQGIGALVTAPVGFDSLAGATQTSLGLKFRGSAARLMFNESYDFSEAAPSIVEPLVSAVKAALPTLGGTTPPTHLVCGGILSRQTWIAQALAKSLNLSLFTFDAAAWAGARGLTLGGNITAANIAPSWLGVLSAASSYEIATPGGVRAWNPVLSGTPLAAAPVVPAILAEPAKPATPPPAVKPAAPAIIPAIIQEPAKPAIIPAIIQEPPKATAPAATTPAKPVTPAVQPKPAVIITPPSKPVEAPKPAVVTPPAKPATPPPAAAKPVEVKPAAAPAKPAPTTPAKPTPPPVAKPAAKPEPAKPSPTAKPAPAPVLSGSAKPATAAPFPPKKNNIGIIIGLAAAVVIGVVVFFVVSGKSKEKEQAAAREKIRLEAEAKLQAEARARAEAEKKAEAERLARQKELEMAEQRLKNAEEEAKRQQEAARNSLLFGRGNLTIATEPTGATVTVGELAPKTSPVSMRDLRLGTYAVTISLPGYDTERRDIEIKEKENTDLGTITLKRQVGTIELTSEPSSLPYEVKPAGSLFVNPSDVQTGQTPATLTGLPVGSYQVTITRANWAPNASTVTVERNGTVKVNGDFPGGTVVITSTPSGATVLRDNKDTVGTTPLTLNGIPLGNLSYTVTLRGFDPVTLTGKLDGGKPLTLNATLLDSDRVMKLSELDERPTPIGQADPELNTAQRAEGGKAVISFVVGRDGIPTDLKIDSATNPGFGKACLLAASKWRFKPGTIRGKPAKSRVSIPFSVGAE